jgi:hypothetical protein
VTLIGIQIVVDGTAISNERISFPILMGLFSTEFMEQCRVNVLFSAPLQVGLFLICFESDHQSDYQGRDQTRSVVKL